MATESMTGRYASYQASMSTDEAQALACEMGLELPGNPLELVKVANRTSS